MPDDLFRYWQEYAGLKPFGHENRLLAKIACLIYNTNRGDAQPVDVDDFLPIARSKTEEREAAMEKGIMEAMKRNKEK
jgi:hypothetical protein